MKEEFPTIENISEGLEKLFPFLTESQRRELEDKLKAALIRELGRIWGEREISEDSMRDNIRENLKKKIKEIKSIPEDEKSRILDRLSRLIPAEELVELKGKIKQSALKRYELKNAVVKSFLNILKKNFGIKEEGDLGALEDMKRELDNIKGKLEKISEKKEGEEREKVLEEILGDLDKIVEKVKKITVEESTLNEIKKEIEEIKKKIRREKRDEVKEKINKVEEELDEVLREIEEEIKNLEGDLNEVLRKIEFDCKKIIKNGIRSLDPMGDLINKIDEIKDLINKIKESGKKEGEERKKVEEIEKKLSEIKDGIERNLSLMGILEKYKIEDELDELCEELETSVDLSAEIMEGLEEIIVRNMRRMVRKDLSLYISWRVGNPLREFYYKVKRGEEI